MSAGPAKNGRFPAILDRSPCGSGTAAVMANLWQKGKLQIGRKKRAKRGFFSDFGHLTLLENYSNCRI